MLQSPPSQSSKSEATESQASKMKPSDHRESEKDNGYHVSEQNLEESLPALLQSGENGQVNTSSSLTNRTHKRRSVFDELTNSGENGQVNTSSSLTNRTHMRRSVFDELTNTFQSQLIQYSKEVNKEFVNVGSKKNKSIPSSMLIKSNDENKKRYKLETTPLVISTTMKPNLNKSCILEDMSLSRKPLVLGEQLITDDTSFIKMFLPFKKCTGQDEVHHLEKSLSWQKETNRDNKFNREPMTSEKKHRAKESVISKSTSSSKNIHTHQRKQFFWDKELTLQIINTEEDSVPESFDKETKIEEAEFSKKILSLKKSNTQVKMPHLKKSPQKVISEKKSPTKKLPFKRKHITESLSQEPSFIQVKCTTKEEAVILKKPQPLQEFKDSECDSFMQQILLKKTQNSKQVAPTVLPLKKKCTIQELLHSKKKKPIILQNPTVGEKSFMKELLSYKMESVTEESIQKEVSTLKKPPTECDQDNPTENSLFKKPLTFTKKHAIEEPTSTNYLLPSKKRCVTQCNIHLLKPVVLESISEEKSLKKEPLIFKKPASEKSSSFNELFASWEKHIVQEKVIQLKNPWTPQENINSKSKTLMEPVSVTKNYATSEAVSTKESVSLKLKESGMQMVSVCPELLHLQDDIVKDEESFCMGTVSFRKKPSATRSTLAKSTLLLNNQNTQGAVILLEKITSEEESFFKYTLPFKQEPTTEKELLHRSSSLLKERPIMLKEVSLPKSPLPLRVNVTTEEKSHIKEPLNLKEEPSTKETCLSQEPYSKRDDSRNREEAQFWKTLALQKNIDPKNNFEEKLTLQKSTSEEKCISKKLSILKKLLTMQEKLKNERDAKLNIEKVMESSAFQHKYNPEEKTFLNEFLVLQQKASNEKQPLDFEKPTSSLSLNFKERRTLSEKCTSGNDLSSKELLVFQKNPDCKQDTFLRNDVSPKVGTSSVLPSWDCSAASQFETGLFKHTTFSTITKLNTFGNPFAFESSYSDFFSFKSKTPWKKMSLLEINSEKEQNDSFFDSDYTEDIFLYLKEREHKFILENYIGGQVNINAKMRALLVGWLVEVQISFEMSPATLHLAVKLLDLYLMKVTCKKNKLQLLGSSAFLLAAKFEEPYPPYVDDFLYICNDLYKRKELLTMETNILKTLNFDINIPTAYHFLQSYAQCICVDKLTLTLSCYICERTLQEYDFIQESASKLAAACFLLALYMQKLHHWISSLECYSDYRSSDLHPLVKQLNTLLTLKYSEWKLNAVHTKYSDAAFFEVTKIPPLDMFKLETLK